MINGRNCGCIKSDRRGKAALNKDYETSLEVNTQIYQAISNKFDIDMISKRK